MLSDCIVTPLVEYVRKDHQHWVDERRAKRCFVASLSGPSSSLEATVDIRKHIPVLFKRFGIKSIVDAPCGDFFWMRHVDLSDREYLGVDILPDVIQQLSDEFKSTPNINFKLLNLVAETVPQCDLIIARDFFYYISHAQIMEVLSRFNESGSKYLLTTSFPAVTTNTSATEIDQYRYQPINLNLAPFHFSASLYSFTENHPANQGRLMGLWKLPIQLPDDTTNLRSESTSLVAASAFPTLPAAFPAFPAFPVSPASSTTSALSTLSAASTSSTRNSADQKISSIPLSPAQLLKAVVLHYCPPRAAGSSQAASDSQSEIHTASSLKRMCSLSHCLYREIHNVSEIKAFGVGFPLLVYSPRIFDTRDYPKSTRFLFGGMLTRFGTLAGIPKELLTRDLKVSDAARGQAHVVAFNVFSPWNQVAFQECIPKETHLAIPLVILPLGSSVSGSRNASLAGVVEDSSQNPSISQSPLAQSSLAQSAKNPQHQQSPQDDKSRSLHGALFFKQRYVRAFLYVKKLLDSIPNLSYDVLHAGLYSLDDYQKALKTADFVVWVGCAEAQNLALEGFLGAGIPAFLWDVTSMYDTIFDESPMYDASLETKPTLLATCAPYWDSSCGSRATLRRQVKTRLTRFLSKVRAHGFQPNSFIRDNLGDVRCMQRILKHFQF